MYALLADSADSLISLSRCRLTTDLKHHKAKSRAGGKAGAPGGPFFKEAADPANHDAGGKRKKESNERGESMYFGSRLPLIYRKLHP